MTDQPISSGLYDTDPDTLTLTVTGPAQVGLSVGLDRNAGNEPVVLFQIHFTDPFAGPICVAFDTRTGQLEAVHQILTRTLDAIHKPDDHPEDAEELAQQIAALLKAAEEEL